MAENTEPLIAPKDIKENLQVITGSRFTKDQLVFKLIQGAPEEKKERRAYIYSLRLLVGSFLPANVVRSVSLETFRQAIEKAIITLDFKK